MNMKYISQEISKVTLLLLGSFSLSLLLGNPEVLSMPAKMPEASFQRPIPIARSQSNTAVDEIILLLDSCPAWSDIPSKDAKTSKALLEHLEKIAAFDLDSIRNAIQKYLRDKQKNAASDVAYWSRVYLLNRYLFQAPESASFDRGTFGGWVGVPHDNDKLNWLWPFSYVEGDKLELTGLYSGYFGHNYFALMEFDYFKQKFGPRKPTVR